MIKFKKQIKFIYNYLNRFNIGKNKSIRELPQIGPSEQEYLDYFKKIGIVK